MTDGSNFKKPVGFGERIDVRVERAENGEGGTASYVVIRQRIAAHGFVVAWVAEAATDARTDSEVLAVNNAYNEPLSHVSSECRDQNRFLTTLHYDLAREPATARLLLACFYGWSIFPVAMHLFLAYETTIPSSTYVIPTPLEAWARAVVVMVGRAGRKKPPYLPSSGRKIVYFAHYDRRGTSRQAGRLLATIA